MPFTIATASRRRRLLLLLIFVSVVVRHSTTTNLFASSPIIVVTITMAFSIPTLPMLLNKKMYFVPPLHVIPRFQQSSSSSSSSSRKLLSNQFQRYNTARNLFVRTTANGRNDNLFQRVNRKGTLITTNRRWNSLNNIVQSLQSTANGNHHHNDDTKGHQSLSTLSSHNDGASTCYDTKIDEEFLQMAVNAAQWGYGYTFPNPAVGCIIVLSTSTTTSSTTTTTNLNPPEVNHTIIGRGYHPRAGYPHAEIFALFEAARHVPCGIQAATSVIQHYNPNHKRDGLQLEYDKEQGQQQLYETVVSLTKQYQGVNGTRILFENCLQPYLLDGSSSLTTKTITAYVTLEPCCHLGKRTPPCTNSLLVSNGISRIVVGSRDPNPQVDGSGIQILQQQQQQQPPPLHDHSQHSTKISIVNIPQSYYSTPGTAPYNCNLLITNFAKRITVPTPDYELIMTGKVKRVLRTFASQMRNNHSNNNNSILPTVSWGSYTGSTNDQNGNNTIINFSAASIDMDELLRSNENTNPGMESNKNELIEKAVNELDILPNWLEHLDGILWQHELVLLRLNKAISKRKGTPILGNRIAQQLKACVVQTKGHTVLLYRPSSDTNPIIDVQNLLMKDDGNDAINDDDEENDS